MKPRSVLIMGGVAIIGSLVWAAVAYFGGYEYYWLGAGIGLAIGASSVPSHGWLTGVMCALLTIASIFAGKLTAMQWQVNAYTNSRVVRMSWCDDYEAEMNEAAYVYYTRQAAAFAELPPDADRRRFLIDHDYADVDEVESVTPEDLEFFAQYHRPHLNFINREKPSYEDWRAYRIDRLYEYMTDAYQAQALDFMVEHIQVLDYFFVLGGILAAYFVGYADKAQHNGVVVAHNDVEKP